jgi:hypothetical protein
MIRKAMLVGVLVLAFAVSFAAQSKSGSIRGAWKLTQVTRTGPSAVSNGNPQPSLYLFTAKHYSIMSVNSEQPRPSVGRGEVPQATADQLRAMWDPFTANSGTYEISGDTLTTHPMVAKNPGVMVSGNFTTYTVTIQGNTLTLVTKANNSGPAQNPTTYKLARLE